MSEKNERKEIIKARFGSYNYNLTTLESDIDYKVFIAPTREDLFLSERYVKEVEIDGVDIKIHDIRELHKLLYKANLNFLEFLFTDDLLLLEKYNKDIFLNFKDVEDEDLKIMLMLDELFNMKNDLAKANLPYLFNSSFGMAYNKRKRFEKFYKEKNMKKAGKALMTSFRMLDFIERFHFTNFSNLEKAMKYTDDEREKILELRKEENIGNNLKILDNKFEEIKKLEDVYKRKEVDEEVFKRLNEILMDLTFEMI